MSYEIPIRARCSEMCAAHCHGQSVRPESTTGYDPVPDVAAILDGLRTAARRGGDPVVLGDILGGAYARLRGGLLLDEPGRENVTTEAALRELLEARR